MKWCSMKFVASRPSECAQFESLFQFIVCAFNNEILFLYPEQVPAFFTCQNFSRNLSVIFLYKEYVSFQNIIEYYDFQ